MYMKQWIKQCSHLSSTEIHNYLMKLLAPVVNEIPIPDKDTGTENVAIETDNDESS